ncbi:MAG TPA: VWA domain-containing protein [Bryobacteraceae bacterium]|nr:VWA domain-containing protein [Bryobacteraceae bacterium]
MRICRFITLLLVLPRPSVAQATPDQAVIQAGTHLVLVNVVAKDKHGKPVADLSRDDFVLRDNGQEQKIALFALEESGGTATAVPISPARLTFTNRPGPGAAAATVFLFDELNTKLTDQEFAKKELLHYLRGLPAASRVAVFALGDSLSLLHDFSEDMDSLLAAIEKHKNRVNPEVDAATAPPASSNSLTGDPKTTAQWDSFMQASNQLYVNYTQTVRAARTAAALETIAGHLQGIPGRKMLIWISGGFPIQPGLHNSVDSIPQSNSTGRLSGGSGGRGGRSGGGSSSSSASDSAPRSSGPNLAATTLPGTGLSFESDVERAIRALNEADVAVYPVDARGVTVAAAYQADRSSIGKRSKPASAFSGPDYNYETLESLAVETGGLAFHHINDLSAAIQQAAGDAQVSYSMAFSPATGSLDDSYHKLEVTVKRPDVKLRYRPGYVAARDAAVAPTLAEAIADPVALVGVGFSVQLDPMEGGYKASVTIDARNITLQPKEGKWTGSLEFLVVVGKVEQLTTIPLSFSDAMFHQIQEKGLVLGARVKTPPGTTGFSMGFRDIPSGLVGTLHVPL